MLRRLLGQDGLEAHSASLALCETLLEQSSIGTFVLGPHGEFRSINTAGAQILGLHPEDIVGIEATRVLFSEDIPVARARFLAAQRGEPQTYVTRIRDRTGTTRQVQISYAPLFEQNQVREVFGIALDVTAKWTAQAQLVWLTQHDLLTRLPNRRAIGRRMQDLPRDQELSAYAVLFFGLHHFREVNASLGHQVGDLLIRRVAQRLGEVLPADAVLARWWGDEFVILLERVRDDNQSPAHVVEQIAQAMSRPFDIGGMEIATKFHIGYSVGSSRHVKPDEICQQASIALYHAKKKGSGYCLQYHPVMVDLVETRFQLASALQKALCAQEFTLYYQPIISLRTGMVLGLEALLRWQHPQRGLLEPEAFLAIAEETGLTRQLVPWVLENACRALREWQMQTENPSLYVHVNVPAPQLTEQSLIRDVSRVLADTGLSPIALRLEVTESAMMHGYGDDGAGTVLHQLRSMGVGISLDDFGTGYSSLAYLKALPVDSLKIDRSFVRGLGVDSKASDLFSAIMSMAAALEIPVLAEGVETSVQLQALQALGCELAQGYLFSRPVPADLVPPLLGRPSAAVVAATQRVPDPPSAPDP